jgi:ACS family allantoate permease-like MFS transporter
MAVVSLCLFLIVGIYTRRVPNRRLYCMAASVVTPFIGLIALSMIENSPATKWTKWVLPGIPNHHIDTHKLTSSKGLYLITVPYVLALFLAWTLIPSNIAGRTKKTIISSCTFLGYCVGNMAGSQIFKDADKPRYGKSPLPLQAKEAVKLLSETGTLTMTCLQSLEPLAPPYLSVYNSS